MAGPDRTGHDRPIGTFAHSHPASIFPSCPWEIRLGNAAARNIYCATHL